MRHSIFISYRRDDSEGEAGRLYDDLVRVYGKNAVFMDVAGIAPGLDFRKAIDDNVAGCGVFLALLGPQWANITGSDGKRRLDDPVDFVRLEVASALARNIAVIPVLVHEARMPHPDQLPDNIKDLAYRNSVEISHARWDSDVNLLVDALKQYVTTSPATETQPVHAAVPVQLPPPVSTDPSSAPSAAKSRTTLIVAGIAVVLFLGVIAYFIAGRKPEPGRVATSSSGASGTGQTIILEGAWRNTSPVGNADSLIMLRISGSGPTYNVSRWVNALRASVPGQRTPWFCRTAVAPASGSRVSLLATQTRTESWILRSNRRAKICASPFAILFRRTQIRAPGPATSSTLSSASSLKRPSYPVPASFRAVPAARPTSCFPAT